MMIAREGNKVLIGHNFVSAVTIEKNPTSYGKIIIWYIFNQAKIVNTYK